MLNDKTMGLSPGLDCYYDFFEQNVVLSGKYNY